VIWHRVAFHQLDAFLTAQLPQYLSYLATPTSKELLLSILWYSNCKCL